MMNLQDTEKIEIIEFDLLDSTNAKAKELAAGGAKPWTVILAKNKAADMEERDKHGIHQPAVFIFQ